jgi:hypothetical protein
MYREVQSAYRGWDKVPTPVLDALRDTTTWRAPRRTRWSATDGWIGFAREELALDPWLNFYASNGYAYIAAPGDRPNPAQHEAPPSPQCRPFADIHRPNFAWPLRCRPVLTAAVDGCDRNRSHNIHEALYCAPCP